MTGCHESTRVVVVDNCNVREPGKVYQSLRQSGSKHLHFLPQTLGEKPVTPEVWGQFLTQIFAMWVREDIGQISVRLFDETLNGWCGTALCEKKDLLKCQTCPGRRLCTAANDDELCQGYLAFYDYSAPFMKVMRDLKKHNRSTQELMALLRQK